MPSLAKTAFSFTFSRIQIRGLAALVPQASFTDALNAAGRLVRLPDDHPPLLLVVIDTEEEFDWHRPHARDNTNVTAIAAQGPAQEIFAKHGLRSPDPDVAKATAANYPDVSHLFDITYVGGWEKATPEFFGADGVYTKMVSQVQKLSQ